MRDFHYFPIKKRRIPWCALSNIRQRTWNGTFNLQFNPGIPAASDILVDKGEEMLTKGDQIPPVISILLVTAVVLYVGMEVAQCLLIRSLLKRMRSKGFWLYLQDLENVLQLLFMGAAFSVTWAVCIGRGPEAHRWTYLLSALSFVIAWVLILGKDPKKSHSVSTGIAAIMEDEVKLQKFYIDLLYKYRIITLLDAPAEIFKELCQQKIETVLENEERYLEQIRSCRLRKRQAKALLRVLKKASYKEVGRIGDAIYLWIQKQERISVYTKDVLGANIMATFEQMKSELSEQVEEAIEFKPPLCSKLSKAGQTACDKPASEAAAVLKLECFLLNEENLGRKADLLTFLQSPQMEMEQVWTYKGTGTTVLHLAAGSWSDTEWYMEFITTVIKFIDETDKLPWTSQEFLDLRDGEGGSKDGSTALHVAITQGSIQAAICFIDLGADIFVTNREGKTCLDLMYELMPEALCHILSHGGLSTCGNFKIRNVNMSLDFGSLVHHKGLRKSSGQAENPKKRNSIPPGFMHRANENTAEKGEADREKLLGRLEKVVDREPEMDRLASTIYCYPETTAPQLLRHIVVKAFLELKWKKLKWPIYLLSFVYITFYVLYTMMTYYIFTYKFPHPKNATAGTTNTGNSTEDSSTVAANGTVDSGQGGDGDERHGIGLLASSLMSTVIVLYAGLECWQYGLVVSGSKGAGWTRKAYLFYFRDLENVLQLLFTAGAMSVLWAVCIRGGPVGYEWTYWVSAFSVVIAWMLILLQLGNFCGLGQYAHMFQTVFKSFIKVMALYICLLVGFGIAFGIIFPQAEVFNFPRSLFRSFAMIAGELEFDEVFNPSESRPFEAASLMLYLGFILVVTIVIGNLLIGLTVDDVAKIFRETDIIHRAIQVERLYLMEHMLRRAPMAWCIQDIFVVPPERREDGAVVITEMEEFPMELQKELRILLVNVRKYEQDYLTLDSGEDPEGERFENARRRFGSVSSRHGSVYKPDNSESHKKVSFHPGSNDCIFDPPGVPFTPKGLSGLN